VTPAVAHGTAARGRPLPAARRPELDVLRALVVAGLVVFHSTVVFATGASWFVKDARPAIGFTMFLLWGLTLHVMRGPAADHTPLVSIWFGFGWHLAGGQQVRFDMDHLLAYRSITRVVLAARSVVTRARS
jgi:hypothetical protein